MLKQDLKRLFLLGHWVILTHLSLLKYFKCVLGNSSSGTVEAPSINIGTNNIEDRQHGRIKAASVYY